MFCTPTKAPGRVVAGAAGALSHSVQDLDLRRENELMKFHLGGRCGI